MSLEFLEVGINTSFFNPNSIEVYDKDVDTRDFRSLIMID